MAISISPAVMFTEIDATGSVPAISTTEAAIAGVFNWGPVLERNLVTSENHLVDMHWKPSDANAETFFTAASFLAYSSGLYVTRVVSDNALNANTNVQIINREAAEQYTGAPIIGRYPGALANNLMISYVASPEAYASQVDDVVINIASKTMKVYDASGNDITIGDVVEFGDDISGRQVLTVTGKTSATENTPMPVVDPAPAVVVDLVTPNVSATVIRVSIAGRYQVGDYIQITGAIGVPTLNGTFEVDAVNGDLVTITVDSTSGSYTPRSASVVRVVDPSWTTSSVTTYTITFSSEYRLMKNLSYASVTRKWGFSRLISNAPRTGHAHFVVVDKTGAIAGKDIVLESFENVSTVVGTKNEDGTSNYYKHVINGNSNWIYLTADDVTFGSAAAYSTMSGGTDGDEEDTIALGALAEGYDLYRSGQEVYVPIIMQGKARGGVAETALANYLVQNIALNRYDCVVTISPGMSAVVNNRGNELKDIAEFRSNVNSSSYWFADSGYKKMYDKYNDTFRWVPLNGDTAGLMARCLPWESPAGYNRGMIKNVVSLAFNPSEKSQRDVLFGMDINPVMTQVGQGTLLFGDKTGLGAQSAFNAINVRRLFIYIEKAVVTYSARILFENNNEFTQARFRNAVEPFLRDLQGQYGIQEFFVDVGSNVNTPDVIDAFTFRGNIYIKPPRSIRFIDLKFVAVPTGLEIQELVSQFQG